MPGDKAPEAIEAQVWRPNTGQDPAKYLVNPGHWDDGAKRMTPGNLVHARPWLDSGRRIFVWPVPTEGFRRTGQTMLALHHYIGDQFVDAQVIHRDEARIEMNGVFPGISGQDAMADFVNTLNDDPPDAGMTLNVPGVFEQLKFVVPESWEFSHDPDDQTHSIAYTVTFVMIGEGRRIPDPSGQAPVNPTEFPGNPVDLGPWDPWQIILGIGTSSQPNGLEYGGGGSPGASSPPSVGGTTGGGIGGYDPTDFIYGNVVPGYTIDQLFAAAKASAPEGGTAIPMHVMKNGEIFYHGDTPGVEIKYSQSDGTNTIWIPLPPPTPGITTASGSTSSYTPPVDTDATTTTTDGNRTLEEIADNEYGDPSYWEEIYAQNEKFLNEFGVTKFNAQAQVFPVGLKIAL